MSLTFLMIAAMTVASAVAAMTLRNLVHCALALTVALAGLAAFYLQLDAQFVGFAQVLVYIGAVAILIVFAILLTRGPASTPAPTYSPGAVIGLAIAAIVSGLLIHAILSSKVLAHNTRIPPPPATVRQIGDQLMNRYVLPLEVIGVLLTAAMIGAVIISMREKDPT
jgi:NADH-quinone oxidoreductase subunit J